MPENTRRFIVLWFAILVIPGPLLWAQTMNFRRYTVDDGLASNTVYRSFQDSKGFIWFGTESGVSRFDGIHFDLFTTKDGLGDNEVFGIHEDSKGRIWFRTFNGKLSYFLDGKFHNSTTDPYLAAGNTGNTLHSFFEDGKGRIWIGVDGGLVIRIQGDTVEVMDDLKGLGVPHFLESDQGEVRAYAEDARFDYDEKSGMFVSYPLKFILGKDLFYSISSSKAYAVSGRRLMLINSSGESEIGEVNADALTGLAEFSNDLLLLSSKDRGVVSLNLSSGKERILIDNQAAHFVMIDYERNVWICTREGGVYMIPSSQLDVQVWNQVTGLEKSTIYDVLVDSRNRVWLGCYDNYVYCIKEDVLYTYELPHEKDLKSRTLSVLESSGGRIIASGDGGLYLFDEAENHFDEIFYRRAGGFIGKSSGAKKLCQEPGGDVWAGRSGGLLRVDLQRRPVVSNFDSSYVGLQRTTCPFFDAKHNLWIGTTSGLVFFEGARTVPRDMVSGGIHDIDACDDGTMAVATDGSGILLFYNEQITDTLDVSDGLTSNLVSDIYCHGNAVWFAYHSGAGRIEVDHGKVVQTEFFGTSEGLISNNVRCIYFHDGKMYAGTDQGLSIIPLRERKKVNVQPFVYIRKISGTWGSREDNVPLELNYLNNNLTLEFAAIAFADPDKVRYQYFLDEAGNWIDCGGHSITLSQLPYGQHHLKIRACINDGIWSEGETISFAILPPFWNTRFFYFLVAFLSLGLIVLILGFFYWRRVLQIRQLKLMNSERDRISEDLHDDIGADLSRIVVACEVLKVASTDNRGSVDKIISTAKNLRNKVDSIIWALNPSNDTLGCFVSYLREFGQEYFENTHVKFSMNDDFPVVDHKLSSLQRRYLFLMVREIFNNVLKHSHASNVTLSVRELKAAIRFEVSDNGVGVKNIDAIQWNNGGRILRKRANEIGAGIEWSLRESAGLNVTIELNNFN